jgi:hypothetical protein
VFLVLRVPQVKTNWPFDLTDVSAAKDYFSQQSANNDGVLLEMEAVKYRSPIPQSMGMMFVGILWIPLRDRTAQVNVESLEHGATGMREAAVSLMDVGNPASQASTDQVIVNSAEEMFTHMRAQPLRALPSDGSTYDQSFPDHPLSKVRRRMEQVMTSISIHVETNELIPPDAKSWWKFW